MVQENQKTTRSERRRIAASIRKRTKNTQTTSTHDKPSKTSISVIVSIRVNGISTSISLKKNIVALWILSLGLNADSWKRELTNFIHDCADSWKNESAKGLSEFVSTKIIASLLEDKEVVMYKKILSKI